MLSRAVAQQSAGGESYWWDELDPDFIVDPARTSNGTGSEGNPYQPSQAFAVNPGGSRVIFEWLPGELQYAEDRGSSVNRPYWKPQFGGASHTNPVIHRARYKAADPAVSSSNYSSFVKTSGEGSIFGTFNTSYVYWDGFHSPTYAGVDGEQFMYVCRADGTLTGCKGVRLHLDANNQGVFTASTGNAGGAYHQNIYDCELADCLIRRIGNHSGNAFNSAVEHYSADGLSVHHVDFDDIWGYGIFEKGATAHANRGNRYYNNHMQIVKRFAFFQYVHATGTTLDDASWWYKNLCHDIYEWAVATNIVAGDQSGVVMQNNTFARIGSSPIPGGTGGGFVQHPHVHAALWVLRNNIFHDTIRSYVAGDGHDWTTYGSAMEINRNLHWLQTAISNHLGTNRTLDYCQNTLGIDVNGTEQNPLFTNAAGNDFTLQGSSPALTLGTDYLNLHGGGTSATIPAGCYTGQSDVMGRRF